MARAAACAKVGPMAAVAGATAQYHPEAGPGPHDAVHLFDRYLELVR